jgi:hypothetical protein
MLAMFNGPDVLKPGTPANKDRLRNIKHSLAIKDSNYNNQHRPFSHKVCMAVIKIITDAIPD